MRGMIVAGLVLVFFAHSALADDSAEAKQHYERGVIAYNLQDFAAALKEFKAAYTAKQDPALLFNIAQCQRQLKQFEAAAKSYRAFIAQDRDSPNADEARQHIAEAERASSEETATRRTRTASSDVEKQAANARAEGVPRTQSESNAAVRQDDSGAPAATKKRKWIWVGVAGGAAVLIAAGIGLGIGLGGATHYPTTSLGSATPQ